MLLSPPHRLSASPPAIPPPSTRLWWLHPALRADLGVCWSQFEPVVGMSALLEFLRFLYTGRSGAMEPLTALEVLFLTKGDEGSGGESAMR